MYSRRSKDNWFTPPDAALLVSQAIRRLRAAAPRTDRIPPSRGVRLVVETYAVVPRLGHTDIGGWTPAARLGGRTPGQESAPGCQRTLRLDAQSLVRGNSAGGGRT